MTSVASTDGQIDGGVGGSGTTAPTSAAPVTTSAGPQTPGFELVALVAALGAALVLVRRKL